MSPEQVLTWGEVAQKFLVPLLLAATSVIGGIGASQMGEMRQEIQNLRVEVAKLQVELAMHRQIERGDKG